MKPTPKKIHDSPTNCSTIKPFGQRVSELQGILDSIYSHSQVSPLLLTSKDTAPGDTNKRCEAVIGSYLITKVRGRI